MVAFQSMGSSATVAGGALRLRPCGLAKRPAAAAARCQSWRFGADCGFMARSAAMKGEAAYRAGCMR